MGVFVFSFCSPVTFPIIGSTIFPLGLLWQHLWEFTKWVLVWILSPCLTIFLPLYSVLWGNVNYIWVVLTFENMCLKGYVKEGDLKKKKLNKMHSSLTRSCRREGGRLHYFPKFFGYKCWLGAAEHSQMHHQWQHVIENFCFSSNEIFIIIPCNFTALHW